MKKWIPLYEEITSEHVQAKLRNVVTRVPFDRLFCFRAEDKYVTAVTLDGDLLLTTTLDAIEEKLGDLVVRARRSHLVPTAYISRVRDIVGSSRAEMTIQVKDTQAGVVKSMVIPVGRRHAPKLRKLYKATTSHQEQL